MNYDYIAAGISIVNDIRYADGRTASNRLGGCAIFAYGGIGLYTASVAFLSSGGPDFFSFYGDYFKENNISEEGIYLTLPHTHKTLLEYEKDGSWHEASLYGEDYFAKQSENNRSSFEKLKPFLNENTKGLYLDAAADEKIFSEITDIRKTSPDIIIMWEPPTFSSKDPSKRDILLNNIDLVDIYSLNLDEASVFFNETNRDKIIERIMEQDKPCFLRQGENGSSFIANKKIASLKAYDPDKAVDVTGCGNCSAAAALYAFTQGYDPYEILLHANVAAGYLSRFNGPAPIKRGRENKVYLQFRKYYN